MLAKSHSGTPNQPVEDGECPERSGSLAKQAATATAAPKESLKKAPKKKLLRRLEKTQVAHQQAERRVGKLRVRLQRAETKLAQRAQRLSATQELLAKAATAKKAVEAATSLPSPDGASAAQPANSEYSVPEVASEEGQILVVRATPAARSKAIKHAAEPTSTSGKGNGKAPIAKKAAKPARVRSSRPQPAANDTTSNPTA
jgi:hypothetical protein